MNEQEKAIREEEISNASVNWANTQKGKDVSVASVWAAACNWMQTHLPSSPPAKEAVEEYEWPLNGYAPGSYQCKCFKCGKMFFGDKRAVCCKEDAIKMYKEWLADPRPEEEKLKEQAEAANKFFSKEPLIDEQLQKETQVLYPTQTNFFGQNIQSQYNELRQEGYIKGRKASEALLKEKEQEITELKWQLNDAKVLNEQKDSEIERLKGADIDADDIQVNDSQLSLIHQDARTEKWFYSYPDSEGLNRHSQIFETKELAKEDRVKFFANYHPEYLQNGTTAHLRKQLTELKEENERLKVENNDLQEKVRRRGKDIDKLETTVADLRALHTQQMEEAWDAGVLAFYNILKLYPKIKMVPADMANWLADRLPGEMNKAKLTYISKITGQ